MTKCRHYTVEISLFPVPNINWVFVTLLITVIVTQILLDRHRVLTFIKCFHLHDFISQTYPRGKKGTVVALDGGNMRFRKVKCSWGSKWNVPLRLPTTGSLEYNCLTTHVLFPANDWVQLGYQSKSISERLEFHLMASFGSCILNVSAEATLAELSLRHFHPVSLLLFPSLQLTRAYQSVALPAFSSPFPISRHNH